MSKMENIKLSQERKIVNFDRESLKIFIYGDRETLEKKRIYENHIFSDRRIAEFVDKDLSYLSHVEKYEEGLRRSILVLSRSRELKDFDYYDIEWNLTGLFSMLGGNPMGVHMLVFVPAIKLFGTSDQFNEWNDKAENFKLIGTYAQTELGHGTFVRGLQTTATFDPTTKEFILNTPSITAYKFWPGGLGHTANFAIVMAQLYSLGQCHGVHAFIVQLRDEETHEPLKGITIGDIGTKFCFPSSNNGFLSFDNVRIPYQQMLMKNSKILDNGEFVLMKNPILTYATMTKVRVGIVTESSFFVAQAATIATRYSLVREQSTIESEREVKILDHRTQQMKIFPAISLVFAMKKAAEDLKLIYDKTIFDVENEDLTSLPELHALSCCMKSVCTTDGARAVENCRLACGGHGYLNSAGFNANLEAIMASQTYEGENTVLLLQTGRFLMKSWQQALNGEKLPKTVNFFMEYLNTPKEKYFWAESSAWNALKIFQMTTSECVEKTFKNYERRRKLMSNGQARNESGIEFLEISRLYAYTFLLSSIIYHVENSSENLRDILDNILEIFYCDLMLKNLNSILKCSFLTSNDVEKLQARYENSLMKFRTNAIGVVDCFEIHDNFLNSTLGGYDGNVYEKILKSAENSTLNQEIVNKSFHSHIKPYLKSNL